MQFGRTLIRRFAICLTLTTLTACANREIQLFTPNDGGPQTDAGVDAGPGFVADSVVAATGHTCAIHSGELYCWGNNTYGQLGVGDTMPRNKPTALDAGNGWVELAAGYESTCARKTDGSVWCWGDNAHLQLGQGAGGGKLNPSKVPLGFAASALALHFEHVCVINAADQSLHCWGFNTEGQLGLNDGYPGADKGTPQPIAAGTQWKQVSCGQGHTCAIRSDGTLWCWGRNSDGEGGIGSTPIQTRTPTQVGTETDWLEIRATQSATCALKTDRSLWCMGDAYDGTNTQLYFPTRIGTRADLQDVELETFDVCTLDLAGAQQCWGRDDEGELGNGTVSSTYVSTPVDIDGGPWSQLAMGRTYRCAVDHAGHLFCTGEDADGQLGVGDNQRRDALTPVSY